MSKEKCNHKVFGPDGFCHCHKYKVEWKIIADFSDTGGVKLDQLLNYL